MSDKNPLEVDLSGLCYYDLRNPSGVIEYLNTLDESEVDDEINEYANHARKDCVCDNCFYGRTELTEQLLKLVKLIKHDN